ncbi:hypothetical protein EVAR_75752_1 [Eumeta japonica]|uniref:Uncharacterized protein n=1 Tax=Eumeta variegata TaxID=151549 RepID=A0A4C1TFF4_EUMVA|nr:hypothetical protein EVAR_75752_1 [Eumeta japonica]
MRNVVRFNSVTKTLLVNLQARVWTVPLYVERVVGSASIDAEKPTEGDLTIIAVKFSAIREDVADHINNDNVCVAQLAAKIPTILSVFENLYNTIIILLGKFYEHFTK